MNKSYFLRSYAWQNTKRMISLKLMKKRLILAHSDIYET